MMTSSTLRDVSIKHILYQSWNTYKQDFIKLYLAYNVIAVPLTICTFVILGSATSWSELPPVRAFLSCLISIADLFLFPSYSCAIIRILLQRDQGQEETIGSAYRFVFRIYGRVFWATILVGIISCISLFFLIIPGLIFLARYTFIWQVLMAEKPSAFKTLKRSEEIVKVNYWKVVRLVLVVILLSFGSYYGSYFLLGWIGSIGVERSLMSVAQVIIMKKGFSYAVSTLIGPYLYITETALYIGLHKKFSQKNKVSINNCDSKGLMH